MPFVSTIVSKALGDCKVLYNSKVNNLIKSWNTIDKSSHEDNVTETGD